MTPGWLDERLVPGPGGLWPTGGGDSSGGVRGGGQARGRGKSELLLATPDWLYCLVGRWAITAGWPSLKPSALCAVLHLVECRSQFGQWDAQKAVRPYVQRALGYWHLPEPPPPRGALPRGAPPGHTLPGAIRLPWSEWRASGESAGVGRLLNALERLALLAAVSGRAPVIPRVPCASRWLSRNQFARAGIADDYVLQLPNTTHTHRGRTARGYDEASVECHLALGGKRCMLPTVVPAWSRARTADDARARRHAEASSPEMSPAARVVARFAAAPPGAPDGARCAEGGRRLSLQRLEALRAALEALRSEPMLEADSELIDAALAGGAGAPGRPLSAAPCESADVIEADLNLEERARLEALRAACPGYFAPRGHEPHHLDWLHRRRIQEFARSSRRSKQQRH